MTLLKYGTVAEESTSTRVPYLLGLASSGVGGGAGSEGLCEGGGQSGGGVATAAAASTTTAATAATAATTVPGQREFPSKLEVVVLDGLVAGLQAGGPPAILHLHTHIHLSHKSTYNTAGRGWDSSDLGCSLDCLGSSHANSASAGTGPRRQGTKVVGGQRLRGAHAAVANAVAGRGGRTVGTATCRGQRRARTD